MSTVEKQDIVNAILERAAEQVGDITGPVLERFYQECPEAHQLFKLLFPLDPCRLEAEMVEQSLYCIMHWYTSPDEIEIILLESVPHHAQTLNISATVFKSLLHATTEVIRSTIPANHQTQIDVWDEAFTRLEAIIEKACGYIHMDKQEGVRSVGAGR